MTTFSYLKQARRQSFNDFYHQFQTACSHLDLTEQEKLDHLIAKLNFRCRNLTVGLQYQPLDDLAGHLKCLEASLAVPYTPHAPFEVLVSPMHIHQVRR